MTRDDLKRSCCAACLGALFVICGNQSLYAVDRLVPSTFPTIQAAEAAASAGDRIVVSPGTYTSPAGGLVIDVANLQLISTGGFATTTIRNNTPDAPVIEINAPGVSIGDVGQGFTIEQLSPGPATSFFDGEVCILIHGDQVKFANPVRVQYNRLSGNQNDAGIMINTLIEAGGLVIQENSFVRNGGAFAFSFAMYFYYADHSSPEVGLVALFDAAVDILNNSGSEIDDTAIDIGDRIYKSNLNISGNNFSLNAGTSDEGVFIYGPVDAFSNVTISNNTITDAGYGIQIHTDVTNHSSCTIANNTLADFRTTGILVDRVLQNSSLAVTGNTLTGDGAADTGLDFATENNSSGLVSGNNISGVDTEGIYCADNSYASNLVISDNTISSTTLLDYGISVDTQYFSETTISGNTISGFDYSGITENEPYTGGVVTISNNSLDADNSGADYGITVSVPSYQSSVTVSGNTCTDFTTAGIIFGDAYESTDVVCNFNTLTALAAGSDFGLELGAVFNESTFSVEGNNAGGFDLVGIVGDDCFNQSSMRIVNNTLNSVTAGCDYGVQYGDVFNESSMDTSGNTANGFEVAGIEFGDCFNETELSISNNTLTGLSTGADFGVFTGDTFNESSLAVSFNSTDRFDMAGVRGGNCFNESDVIVRNNVLNAYTGGAQYGMLQGDFYNSSNLIVITNEVGGYGNMAGSAGLHLSGGVSDSTFTVANNTFTPKNEDAEFGIHLTDGIDEAGLANISNNTINGFTDSGIGFAEIDTGARVSCNYNQINGKASSGGHFGINCDGDVSSASYFEAIGNSIGNINGDPASHTGGFFINGGTSDGSAAVICNNFIRALAGQTSGSPTYLMSGIAIYYAAQGGSSILICDNNVAGFVDAQVFFYYRFKEGSEFDVRGNILDGGHYGIWTSEENIGDGTAGSITRNVITGFDSDGISLGEVWGSKLDISENKITGNNSANGIIITDLDANEDGVNTAAEVTITHNCFASVQDGIEIETVLDTAFVDANQNDFNGVLDVGIKNAGGGGAKFINGENNFFGAVPNKSSGNVGIDPELASPPDIDGDGVGDCDDQCYDTASGDSVNGDGCSCLQLNPSGDADGDGTIDCADGCPNDPNKTSAGACGCGAADEDADADGVADCNDGCVNGQGPDCPPLGGGCGFCGMGTASMMPFAVLGLMAMHRRRWSWGRRSKRPIPSARRH